MEDEKTNEVNFNKVTQWLEEYHFSLQNVHKISDSKSDLKFYCEVRPYPSRFDFFKIIISDKFKDAIILHKTVFYAFLNNKQYFFDSIYNIINAMQLVNAIFDDFRNSLFPEGE